MVFRAFIFFIGFGLTVAGGVSLIGYLNLLTIGKDFHEYIHFIIKKPECYLFLLGIVLIVGTLLLPNKKSSQDL